MSAGKRRRKRSGHQVRRMIAMLPRVKATVVEKPLGTPSRARSQPSWLRDDVEDPYRRPSYG